VLPDMTDKPLNSYTIIQNLHHSRRFSLYHARQIESGKEVFIKTPEAFQAKNPELASILLNEVSAHLQLSHPNIRACYEKIEESGNAFLIGEYIEGKSLVEYLMAKKDSVNLGTVLIWVSELLEAVSHAHSQGLVHLNLNPYNVMVDCDNHLKIIGFGKSKAAYLNSEDSFYTYHPIMFVAPELFQSGLALPAADIYSIAVLAYLMLCEVVPWRIDLLLSPEKQKQQSLGRAVIMPEILKKDVPDWLFAVLLQCLKLDPHQRYSSAAEMLLVINKQGTVIPEFIPEPIEEVPESLPAEPEPVEPEEPELVPDTVIEPEQEEPVIIEPATETVPVPEEEPLLISELQESQQPEPEEPEPDYSFVGLIEHEAEIIKPVSVLSESPETILESAEPVIAASIEPPQEAVVPKPEKPKPVASMYQTYPGRQNTQPVDSDSTSLKKTFKLLMWLSLVILLFVLIKYVAFSPRYRFSSAIDSLKVEVPQAAPGEVNQPIEMISVPSDTLVMGSIAPEADDDEFPLLTIKIPAFLISNSEITQSQWLMVFPQNPSQHKGMELPVENVSFYDAIEFCNAKSLKDGLTPCYDFNDTEVVCNFELNGYRLPTEAEWEFAAKSAKRHDFFTFSGGEKPNDLGWYNDNSNAASHPAGSKKPNQLGLYDMSGNLYEWVWNWYSPYSYRINDHFKGPVSGTDKVIRGGSWYHPVTDMRVTARGFAKPFTKNGYIGFRVVRSY